MANSVTLRVTTETFQEFRVFVGLDMDGHWRWSIQRPSSLDGDGPARGAKHGSRNAALAAAMAELLDWAEEGA